MSLARAVFVDRDGTLIAERNYLADPAEVAFTPGAPAAVRALRAAGFKVVVVSNQAGIARGLFTAQDVRGVERRIEELLLAEGTGLDGAYYCPHHPDFGGPCRCRKPEPGMLLDAARDLGLELSRSYMVGDKLIDVEAGRRAGAKGILVRTGYGAEEAAGAGRTDAAPDVVCDDLAAAARWILSEGT
jgi:D-glycero-D-manno-heptose 1,7-bisphosphate phosphatase